MSIPRSPRPVSSLALVGAATLGVLAVSWLTANVIICIWRVADLLEDVLWP